jgi:methyl-accepting chemotaxis protein
MKDNFFNELEACNGSDVEGLVNRMKQGVGTENKGREKFLVDGEECYLFYTPVKYSQWILVSVVPSKALDMLSYMNGAMVVLIILLAILLIVIAGHYYIKNGIEPLKQLTQVADDIAKGKYDTPMPDIKYNDEICQLRDSIEEMQYKLFNYTDNGRKQ